MDDPKMGMEDPQPDSDDDSESHMEDEKMMGGPQMGMEDPRMDDPAMEMGDK